MSYRGLVDILDPDHNCFDMMPLGRSHFTPEDYREHRRSVFVPPVRSKKRAFDDLDKKCAAIISEADAIVVASGEYMSAVSWKDMYFPLWSHFPPSGVGHDWFNTDPMRAWGFYGLRCNAYSISNPHQGYRIVTQWLSKKEGFVVTSSTDGSWIRSGIQPSNIFEIYGSMQFSQCANLCCPTIWSMKDVRVVIDVKDVVANEESVPLCSNCHKFLRPNVWMSDKDKKFNYRRYSYQQDKFEKWKKSLKDKNVLILDLYSNDIVPFLREIVESSTKQLKAKIIRFNKEDTTDNSVDVITVYGNPIERLSDIDLHMET